MNKEFRKERIDKLLWELKYEIQRGLMENEIDETMGFTFIHGSSRSIPDGVVRVDFSVKPVPKWQLQPSLLEDDGKLKVIK